MKARIWFAVLAVILVGTEMRVDAWLAQGPGGSGQFRSDFGSQTFPGGSSALGRSWFFTPGLQSRGRGWDSGFRFGAGAHGFGGAFRGRGGSLPLASYPFFYGQYPGYGPPMGWQNSNTNSFVEQWANRNPFDAPKSGGLAGSPLLSEGMKEEEVIKILGSPIQKTSLGEVEVWKYSSFSLYFQGGVLKSLR